MPAKVKPQLAMDETVVDAPAIEALLEDWAKRKHSASELTRQRDDAKAKAVGVIEAELHVPEEGAIRIGRFRVTKAISKSRSVSFTTKEKTRITLAEGDE